MEIPIGLNLPDQQVVDPLGQHLENVVVGAFGVRMRPGASSFIDLGTSAGIDGLYDWRSAGVVISVSGGKVFKLTGGSIDGDFLLMESSGFVLNEESGKIILEAPPTKIEVTGATALASGTRVSFAEYSPEILYMANGNGTIQELHIEQDYVAHGGKNWKCILNHTSIAGASGNEPGVATASATYWTEVVGGSYTAWGAGNRYGSGVAQPLEDASISSFVISHICILDDYLLALEKDTDFVWFSDVGVPWSWSSGFVRLTELTDNATAMFAAGGAVYVCGNSSIEQLVNDGISPWAKSNYGAIPVGVLAPYSFIYCQYPGTAIFLDDNRRLVRLEGRNVVPVNPSLDTFLRSVPIVTDGIADFVIYAGVPYYILQFVTSQQTVCVDLETGAWSEWYTTAANNYRWIGGAITNVPVWDSTIIGHISNGVIYVLSDSYEGDEASPITAKIRSPRLQTGGRVVTPQLTLHFTKVVNPSTAGTSSMTVRWRDDGKDWVSARTVTLSGGSEKTDFTQDLYRLGSFRRYRQFEFDCTNLNPYALTKVEMV